MPAHYRAYLLRHWLLPDGQERVEVQYVATGARQLCYSLPEATAWLQRQGQGQVRAPTPAAPQAPGVHRAPPGDTSMDGSRGSTRQDTEQEEEHE